MRASSLVALVGFLSLTVSCAHKTTVDTGDQQQSQAKIEKKIETKAEAKQEDKQLAYTCLVGKDRRTITMDRKEKKCEVNYTKFGDAQQVAWAQATPKICEDAFSKIRTNIEGAGYKCLDGADAKFEQPIKEEAKKTVETAANTTKTK